MDISPAVHLHSLETLETLETLVTPETPERAQEAENKSLLAVRHVGSVSAERPHMKNDQCPYSTVDMYIAGVSHFQWPSSKRHFANTCTNYAAQAIEQYRLYTGE